MLVLPKIQYAMKKSKKEIVAMRGINYSDMTQAGDMADSLGISALRYPYITTRNYRPQLTEYANITAMTAWDKLVAVRGTDLLFDGDVVGTVTEGAKQFAVVNTKLVIWPDKVYLDLSTQTVKELGAMFTGQWVVFTTNTMTIGASASADLIFDLTTMFKVGDSINISGCTTEKANNKNIVIKGLTESKITVAPDTFTAVSEDGFVTLTRSVPDIDFICESENRLWGCSNSAQTLYASALGDPTNFNVFEGLSTDSYALAVGSEGNFTGCCKLASSVLFWKETKLHKMLGSYPAEYNLYTYDIEGLRSYCHKSIQVINEVLFYMGLHGIYAFSGGTPTLISANFGNRDFSDAVAGNDGDSYYLSVREGTEKHLFVYETRAGIWVHDDTIYCTDFARIGRDLYMLTEDGSVFLATGTIDDGDINWMAQFTPFYTTIQGRKTNSKIILRLELPKGSYATVSVRFDSGPWKEVSKFVGKSNDAVPARISLERCDKFEIKLSGKGPCTILSMMWEFSVGSEV